jgi:hypothetical protein
LVFSNSTIGAELMKSRTFQFASRKYSSKGVVQGMGAHSTSRTRFTPALVMRLMTAQTRLGFAQCESPSGWYPSRTVAPPLKLSLMATVFPFTSLPSPPNLSNMPSSTGSNSEGS